ncbi:lipoate--protein ligase family protein [Carboxylicivirga marina]|uniref:lipoate--protein ligase n=1 Tax=Carboxylicivirga marina TaxID=2800988 RepID=A0ABS1HG06_9BACT|nr:lipoate--protein ligase [Carboxylicivirga marina]MBK3516593.1 lipoate--protein ligase [Carboxylicivirga marina]
MNGLLSNTNDPAINLATEEYLLRHSNKDVFFLYTNSPSIIVGKHQNTLAEINYSYINAHNIPVYRRLSGGGTVYHDLNNLNFCFIQTGEKGHLVNFERYSEPILLALKELGIHATFGKRHDIQIDGKKVSGNASHVFKTRVMHHGTLLFSSDLSVLNNSLKTNPLIIKDKAVKSVRSEVTNISNYVDQSFTYTDFVKHIFNYLLKHYSNSNELSLDNEELKQIKAISRDKYNTWEWNYGYSPVFELNKRYKLESGVRIQSRIKIEKGVFTECEIKTSDSSIKNALENLAKNIIGHQHNTNDILYLLNSSSLTKSDNEAILNGFFS